MILFLRSHGKFPQRTLQRLRKEGAPAPRITENGSKYTYRWRDMRLVLRVPPYDEMLRTIGSAERFVWDIYDNHVPKRGRKVIARLHETRLVVFFWMLPRIGDLRLARFYTRLCKDLDPLFHAPSFIDCRNRAFLNDDRTYDRGANID